MDNQEERECERCGHLIGTMSKATWDALNRLCEECSLILHGPGREE